MSGRDLSSFTEILFLTGDATRPGGSIRERRKQRNRVRGEGRRGLCTLVPRAGGTEEEKSKTKSSRGVAKRHQTSMPRLPAERERYGRGRGSCPPRSVLYPEQTEQKKKERFGSDLGERYLWNPKRITLQHPHN